MPRWQTGLAAFSVKTQQILSLVARRARTFGTSSVAACSTHRQSPYEFCMCMIYYIDHHGHVYAAVESDVEWSYVRYQQHVRQV